MNGQSLLIQALVYLTAGVISAPIAKRLGLGSVLGYLIAGVVVGPFALGLAGGAADIMRFAEFGVVILLFLIGLEVRPALLWKMRGLIFGLGLAQMAFSTGLIAAIGLALGASWQTALATGLILAMSSTAIVLASLEEKGLRQGTVGQSAFGVLLFQDLAVIPLFAILPILGTRTPGAEAAGDHGGGLIAGLPGGLQALALFGAVAVVIIGGRYLTRPLFRFIAAARLREIFTATALLLVVAVAALMEFVGLSPALGAFLAGVVLADSEFRRELETDIEPFRGLFLGLFFITVGAGMDLGLVASKPIIIVGAAVTLMAVKGVAMYVAARLVRIDRRSSLTSAVALAQGGEFAFVLLGFAVSAHALDAEQGKLLTAVVALSMAATPLAMAGYERLILNRRIAGVEPEHIPFDEGDPDAIVAGFGRFGQIASRLLMANDFKVVLLDSSIEQIDSIRRFGWRVHYGDASRIDLLHTAGAAKARLLLVAIDDRDKTLELVEAARQSFPHLKIVARAFDRAHAYELMRRGVEVVERETFEGALTLGRKALVELGLSERRSIRVATLFRQHDKRLFDELAPVYGEEERFITATKDSRATMERLLQAEVAQLAAEEEEEERLAAETAAMTQSGKVETGAGPV